MLSTPTRRVFAPSLIALALVAAAACSRGKTDSAEQESVPPANTGQTEVTPSTNGAATPEQVPGETTATDQPAPPAGQRSDSYTGADESAPDR